jgi:Flp pilus assembly pilin Flp
MGDVLFDAGIEAAIGQMVPFPLHQKKRPCHWTLLLPTFPENDLETQGAGESLSLIMATEPGVKPKLRASSPTNPRLKETFMDLLVKFSCDEAGASAVEYAFLLAFIAVTIAASVMTFGNAVRDSFSNSSGKLFP